MNIKELKKYMQDNGILMFTSTVHVGNEKIVMSIDRFSSEEDVLDLIYRLENEEDERKDFSEAVMDLIEKNTRRRLNDKDYNFNAEIKDGSLTVLSLESLKEANQNIRHVLFKDKVFDEIYKSNPSLETCIKTRKNFNPTLLTDEEVEEILKTSDEVL